MLNGYTCRPVDVPDAHGQANGIFDPDGWLVGIIVKTDRAGWMLRSAGIGVDLPDGTWARYTQDQAVIAILNARRASPALKVDASGLCRRDRDVLDIAGWGVSRREQEAAAYDLLGMRPVHYWQRLNTLLENPDATRYAAPTVNRLRRLRDEARAARSARPDRALVAA